MREDLPPDLRHVRARIRAALPELAGSEALLQWFDGLPSGGPGPDEALRVRASVSANVERVTLSAVGPLETMLGRTARYLVEAGVSDDELHHLARACETLEPEVVGSWIEVGPDGIDGGWLLPGPCPLDDALNLAPDGEPRTALVDWADTHDIDTCLLIKHSVGEQTTATEVIVPLPPGDPATLVRLAATAIEAMGAPALPDDLQRAMVAHARGAMALCVTLVADGLAKVGVLLVGPAPELQTALVDALGTPEIALDRFTVALGSTGPDRLEVQQLAEGVDVELHFNLAESPPTD